MAFAIALRMRRSGRVRRQGLEQECWKVADRLIKACVALERRPWSGDEKDEVYIAACPDDLSGARDRALPALAATTDYVPVRAVAENALRRLADAGVRAMLLTTGARATTLDPVERASLTDLVERVITRDCHGAGRAGLVTGWVSRLERRYADIFATPDVQGDDLVEVVNGRLALWQ
jgi:hypothetical protein